MLHAKICFPPPKHSKYWLPALNILADEDGDGMFNAVLVEIFLLV